MSTELVVPEQTAVTKQSNADIMDVIARAAKDGVNVDAMERLWAMKERMDRQSREEYYAEAMARVQPLIPRIGKNGRIVVNGQERSRYARLEDIDAAIRPIIGNEGFALSFDTEFLAGQARVIGKLTHRQGHSETKSVLLPIDTSGSKNNVQGVGSTVSYGRRMLIKMFFNVIESDEDDDGNGGSQPITAEQELQLLDMIEAVTANKAGFLKYMGVDKVTDIAAKDFKRAMEALKQKAKR